MTSNRPFFSNFLSACRARSGVQKASTSANGAVSGASLSSAYAQAAAAAQAQAQANGQSQTQSTPSQPVSKTSIPTGTLGTMKDSTQTSTSPPAAVPTAFSPPRHPRHHHHHQVHHIPKPANSHPSPPLSRSPGPSTSPSNHSPFGSYPRQRRESDSSSEGFREVMGADKWYVGGRTAAGEEKFYKLGLVRRPRSLDRVSLDRISL